jgi:hypothetical protein
MTFEELYTSTPIGAAVRVSDGTAKPPETAARFSAWRSHNFEGAVLQKDAGPPRRVRIEALNAMGVHVSYWIDESVAHQFALV